MNDNQWLWLKEAVEVLLLRTEVIEQKVDGLIPRAKPTKGMLLLLECPMTSLEFHMAKKSLTGMVAVPNFTMAELASKGAVIQLFDAGDNPCPLPTTPHDHTWTSGDPTVLTVTVDPTDPDKATVTSTGKVGTNIPIKCILHATDSPPSFADLDCECTVTVPAGPPVQGTIALAP